MDNGGAKKPEMEKGEDHGRKEGVENGGEVEIQNAKDLDGKEGKELVTLK